MTKMRLMMRKQDGQGMTEYIVIVALIAIAAIAVVTVFGDHIRKIFGASVNALANSSSTETGAQVRYNISAHRGLTDFAKCGSNNPYNCSK